MMSVRVLLTGFGPFPGAPFNPTGEIIRQLAALRQISDVTLSTHIFETSYRAVDRDLPRLVAKHKPDVLLMFGLATRANTIRIETRARNSLAMFPDTSGTTPKARSIARNASHRSLMLPAQRLLIGSKSARVPIVLSRDAGRYLCNYLCWQAAEAKERSGGPKITAFIHVPKVRLTSGRHDRVGSSIRMRDLVAVGAAVLRLLIAEARRT